MSLPPPDQQFDPTPFVREGARIFIVGLTDDPEVEVLASDGQEFFRFVLPKHSRTVRGFWRSIGVKNPLRLQEGAYESKEGYGPFHVSGEAIGWDVPEEDEPGSVGTTVLVNVTVRG